MRKGIVFLLLLIVSLANVATAQSRSAHDVRLSIPNILRLKLDDGASRSSADVDIDIRVTNGAFEIAPASSNVQVMANSAWQLSASYVPASAEDAAAHLMWRDSQEPWTPFTPYPQLLKQGENTGGWQGFDLHYGLQTLPADGHYQGTVTYTVTRP